MTAAAVLAVAATLASEASLSAGLIALGVGIMLTSAARPARRLRRWLS